MAKKNKTRKANPPQPVEPSTSYFVVGPYNNMLMDNFSVESRRFFEQGLSTYEKKWNAYQDAMYPLPKEKEKKKRPKAKP